MRRVARLADVVHERRQPERQLGLAAVHHGQRVPQDVLVAVHRILFEAQGRKLGQEPVRQPRLDQQRQPHRRRRREQGAGQLVADAFRRHDVQALGHLAHRAHHALGRRQVEHGGEPRRPQHPERIVAERDVRVERRVQLARRQRTDAAERIDQLAARQLDGHRVDGEVAPRQVGLEIVAERHRGLALVVRVHLLAKRGDLDAPVALARADRSEANALQVARVGPPLQDANGVLGTRVGREVDVGAFVDPAHDEDPARFRRPGPGGTRRRGTVRPVRRRGDRRRGGRRRRKGHRFPASP